MKKNIVKTLFISLILIFSIAFINIDVKADNHSIKEADGNGYAKCYYTYNGYTADGYAGTTDGGVTYRPYKLGILVYKDKSGNFKTTASLGCGKGENGSFNRTTSGTCTIDNINDFTNNNYLGYFIGYKGSYNQYGFPDLTKSQKDFERAKNNPKYECPENVYVALYGVNNNVSVYVSNPQDGTKCKYDDSTNTGVNCSKWKISSKNTKQTGKPSSLEVHDYTSKVQDKLPGQSYSDANTVEDTTTENIAYWAKQNKTEDPDAGYTNCDLIPKSIIEFLDNLFLIIQIIGILLLIFLTAVEFIKVLTGSEEKGITDALKHTVYRIIAVIILLILPVFITWILNIVNDNRYVKQDGNYAIGTDGNPLCK